MSRVNLKSTAARSFPCQAFTEYGAIWVIIKFIINVIIIIINVIIINVIIIINVFFSFSFLNLLNY